MKHIYELNNEQVEYLVIAIVNLRISRHITFAFEILNLDTSFYHIALIMFELKKISFK